MLAAMKGEPARLVHVRARISAVQIIWKCPFADEQYVTEQAWESAILERCPFHPDGGCGLEKLGSYPRVEPDGTRIARWWCPKQKASISLLPSFLAARLSGTLASVEAVVAAVEEAGSSEAAVDTVYPPEAEDSVGLVCALRAMRRRVRAVRAALLALVTLMPERFAGIRPTLAAFRESLGPGCQCVLVALRGLAERHLGALPAPVGLRPRWAG
jgi:hypothetical protein